MLYMERWPLPSYRDFGVLCTFTNNICTSSSSSSWDCQKLPAEQLSSFLSEQAYSVIAEATARLLHKASKASIAPLPLSSS
jgi:hypothetical protein